jgi:NAD(P)-dependent dehydrogenase (short-subunit alcohol dehydrogenase family)
MNIVVTGASKGIGYHTSLKLAEMGKNKIFALSRDVSLLNDLSKIPSHSKFEGEIVPVQVDITSAKSISEAVSFIGTYSSSIDVLINNAGFLINKSFDQLTEEDWKMIYGVNVFGLAQLTQMLLPLMDASQRKSAGHIVNISSIGGIQGSQKFKGLSAYSSSKGAVSVLTECMAEEFRSRNIRVNCLALGSVDTEMFSGAFPGYKVASSPEEIAELIANFSLTGTKYFNGKIIPVSVSTP